MILSRRNRNRALGSMLALIPVAMSCAAGSGPSEEFESTGSGGGMSQAIGPVIKGGGFTVACLVVCVDDHNACTHCVGTTCNSPLNCDDKNPCTTDTCNSDPNARDAGCVHTANTAACSDGDPCTTEDKCSNKVCAGTPIGCDDNQECTTDTCEGGNCVFTPVDDDAECDDGNACTDASSCQQGRCVGTGGPDCSDDNPCTQDLCEGGDCDNTQLVDADTPCLSDDRCLIATACSEDGECIGEEKDCDDGNPCTADSCESDTGCVHVPDDDAECSDGSACTVGDHCDDGECVPDGDIECNAIDDCHDAGDCDPDTGVCDDPRKADGEECGMGEGICESGVCNCDGACPVPTEGGASGEGGAAGSSGEAGGAAGGSGEAGGAAGSPDTGDAGDTSAAGSAGDASATGGRAEGGSSGTDAGSAGEDSSGSTYKREKGGCAVTSSRGSEGKGLALVLGLLGLGLFSRRRARRSA